MLNEGFHPVAETMLHKASEARNQGPMTRTSAPPGTERMLSSGLTDKVEINEQPQKNTMYDSQNVKQNILSAIPGAQANAIQGVRKDNADMSQAEYKANLLADTRKSEILYANDGGAALMKLATIGNDEASARNFMGLIAETKVQSAGNNPHTKFRTTQSQDSFAINGNESADEIRRIAESRAGSPVEKVFMNGRQIG